MTEAQRGRIIPRSHSPRVEPAFTDGHQQILAPSAAVMSPITEYNPGDMVVFAGRCWTSRLIALGSCTPIQLLRGWFDSHIGICAEYQGKTLLFESTTLSGLPCAITGDRIHGTKAVDPAERVGGYDGKVWILRPDKFKLGIEQSEKLTDFLVSMVPTPYEDMSTLAVSATRFRNHWLFRENTNKLFCSEYAALALERINWLPPGNASIYSPSKLVRRVVYQGTYHRRERIK